MYGVLLLRGQRVADASPRSYVITMILDRQRMLGDVLHEHQFYFLGTLLFAFTVFYAYVSFSQYFIIWNANMPEETFWYVLREQGSWFSVGLVIIFGHFFVPFLALLRIDVKQEFRLIAPLARGRADALRGHVVQHPAGAAPGWGSAPLDLARWGAWRSWAAC